MLLRSRLGEPARSIARVVCRSLCLVACCTAAAAASAQGIVFPGPAPGEARARLDAQRLTLENDVLSVTWDLRPGHCEMVEVIDRLRQRTVRPGTAHAFTIHLADGRALAPGDFRRVAGPAIETIEPQPEAVRLCNRFTGRKATVIMASADGRIEIAWSAVLRDGANYVGEQLNVTAADGPLEIKSVQLVHFEVPDAQVVGTVAGSPVVAGGLFLACEHPMASHRVEDGTVVGSVPRFRPVRPGRPWTIGSVVGVAPAGQLRRAVLHYVERERARPYRPLAYYISWFDLAAPGLMMESHEVCLDRIRTFGDQLLKRRGVKLDAYVFDDGWDDPRSLWRFHAGFPKGFAPLAAAAGEQGAIVGTWISPWGGYGKHKAQRLEYGRSQGFETNAQGFSLAGPKYYERFRDVCLRQIEEYGVGYFKFDGVGSGDMAKGDDNKYGPDLEALLDLITDLRAARPGLFINTTVGTWPSPFWLWYSDSVWRSGGDVALSGPGNTRQQWLTYRDTVGRRVPAERGPLYPINSLKFQSVMCAPLSLAGKLSNDPAAIIEDVRMAAASGTQLQEFFVRPELFTPPVWDAVAEAIAWNRRNADVLVDTHAIGGDSGAGEVYGYASWSPRKGIVVLRNPAERPAEFSLDVAKAFELPDGAPRRYVLESPWSDSDRPQLTVEAERPATLELAPFEVVVLEGTPSNG
jgi:hypothetical protein